MLVFAGVAGLVYVLVGLVTTMRSELWAEAEDISVQMSLLSDYFEVALLSAFSLVAATQV